MSGPVRPELGPTLPALLERRYGIAPRRTLAVAAALVIAAGAAAALLHRSSRGTLLVHRADPQLGILYRGAVHPVSPHPGEYLRLAARGRRVRLSLVVAPIPGGTPVTRADLPIRAARYLEALQGRFPGLVHEYDARARLNDFPGYEVRFRAGTARQPIIGQDLLMVRSDTSRGEGVVVSLRQRNLRPRLRPADRKIVLATKKALRSFSFGTGGP